MPLPFQTVADLGQKVKAKYPGVYDDMSDADVGQKVKTKFPGSYDDFVDMPAGVKGPLPGMPAAPVPTALSEQNEGPSPEVKTAIEAVRSAPGLPQFLYGSLHGAAGTLAHIASMLPGEGPAKLFDSACLEFIIGDPLISVEALNELRDVLNTLHSDAGKCDKPLLNTFRKGDTHESSGKPAPAAKPQVDECIADGDGRREERRTASGDHGSTSRGDRERRRRGISAGRES